ncbi:MAG TPA: RHS repeat-associated core domain-containing protein [Longimicrobium sp.]|nr:RHS repeat-associated core domain-containing protein [Longimicrobium sp.]
MGSLLEGQRDPGGQMYMRNRYYDPATGQFTQTDPIGIAGGLNTYGFAAGDPVGNWDPFGTCAWGIGPDAAHGRCSEEDPYPRDKWGLTRECKTSDCHSGDKPAQEQLLIVWINAPQLIVECRQSIIATTQGHSIVETPVGPRTIETLEWHVNPVSARRKWWLVGPVVQVRYFGTVYVRKGSYRTALPLRATGFSNCYTGDLYLEGYIP